jgi:hypothetical protein
MWNVDRPERAAPALMNEMEECAMALLDEREIELKKIAAQLTAAMLDNHNGDWDDTETAQAFRTIYEAVRSA